jgi:hypothetical protein
MKEPTRPFRRKRRFQGETWTPAGQSAFAEDGLWCRQCRMRHGYKTMELNHERRDGTWRQLWSCPKYHTVLEEKELGRGNA